MSSGRIGPGSDIRSALLSEVVSANTRSISREQRIHCVAEDTAERFVCVNLMIDAAMQKIRKLFALALNQSSASKNTLQRTTTSGMQGEVV